MTLSTALAEASTTTSPTGRYIETRVETSSPGIFLSVTTSHRNKQYVSRVERVKIEDGILEMKISAARLQDPAPLRNVLVAAPRYSAKKLGEAHDSYLELLELLLSDCLTWAERY